jgi:WD40 repeat protein
VTASRDKTAKVYEVSTEKEVFSIPHGYTVMSASFSADSKYVVTASEDKTAKVTQLYQTLDGE